MLNNNQKKNICSSYQKKYQPEGRLEATLRTRRWSRMIWLSASLATATRLQRLSSKHTSAADNPVVSQIGYANALPMVRNLHIPWHGVLISHAEVMKDWIVHQISCLATRTIDDACHLVGNNEPDSQLRLRIVFSFKTRTKKIQKVWIAAMKRTETVYCVLISHRRIPRQHGKARKSHDCHCGSDTQTEKPFIYPTWHTNSSQTSTQKKQAEEAKLRPLTLQTIKSFKSS